MGGGFLNLYAAWGIPLDKFFNYVASKDTTGNNAGINTASLARIFFATQSEEDRYNKLGFDGYGSDNAWYWSKYGDYTNTLDGNKTARYFYPDFAKYFDFSNRTVHWDETGSREDDIKTSASSVPSMLMLRYIKSRITSESEWDSFLSDYSSVSSLNRYDNRLIFGQYSPSDINVRDSVENITAIYCVYAGCPTVTLDTTQITGKIGETSTVQASISSADPLISEEGLKDIVWTSEDENVARVRSNGDGSASVTIVGSGDVKIKATFGNSSYSEFVTAATANVSGPGGSGWRGDGEGAGWSYGDGDGEVGPGAGANNGTNNGVGDGDPGSANDGLVGDAEANTNVGDDGKNANANDSVFEIGSSDSLTKLPDNAVRVLMNNSALQQTASSSASLEGDGGTTSSDVLNENNAEGIEDTEIDEQLEELIEELPEEEWQTAYKINFSETNPETEVDKTDTVAINWETVLRVLAISVALFMLGAALQYLYFRHSLGKTFFRAQKRRHFSPASASF